MSESVDQAVLTSTTVSRLSETQSRKVQPDKLKINSEHVTLSDLDPS